MSEKITALEVKTKSEGIIDVIDITGKGPEEISNIKKRWGKKTMKVGGLFEETKFTITVGKYISRHGKLVKKG